MDPSCLQYCMTDAQRDHFEQQGYLIVEDALDGDMLGRLLEAGDRVDAEERAARGLAPNALLSKFRTIVEDDVFLELLDWPKTFPLIWDILGWNVQHYISHLIYYPPESNSSVNLKPGGWHQDGGRPVPEMERPQPRLSLKVGFWLTDISEPERGGIRIVPESHKGDHPPDFADAMQVQVKTGTAVLFDRRMWHARGINTSETTRKSAVFGI